MAASIVELLPFRSRVDFTLLVEFWRREAASDDSMARPMAEAVLAALEDVPEFGGPIDDLAVLDSHTELLDRMMSALVPLGTADQCFAAAVMPIRLIPFYQTPAARQIGLFDQESIATRSNVSPQLLSLGKAMAAYETILDRWLGIKAEFQYPVRLTVPCEGGLERHFALRFDTRFLALAVEEGLEKPSREDLERVIAEPTKLDLWRQVLPPEKFSFEGLTIITATDITPEEAVSRLKNDLIAKDAMASPEGIDHLQSRLRTLLRRPELQLGLIGFRRHHDFNAIQTARAVGRSLLLCDGTAPVCPNRNSSWYAEAFKGDPVIVYDLEKAIRSTFEQHLVDRGHRNLLICPLFLGEKPVGMLELSSPNPGDLNAFNALLLRDVAPLFARAVSRSLEELEDRVQAVIKERYTAIHPSVEWRFREAALSWIETAERTGETPEPEQIVFEEVYPLYGLADIRGSSTTRNQAIAGDLGEQLELASGVVDAAAEVRTLPALEEIRYRSTRFLGQLDHGLRSSDESSVLEFLQQDVEPLFGQLSGFAPEVAERIESYRSMLDPGLRVLYRRRRDFEQSVARINDTVARVLDEEEVRAQAIFPHYFEKFETDGVDYSIYVGKTLQQNGNFDTMYLRSLRIWQLMVACRVDWELARVDDKRLVPLDVTQLVLVQDQPLSIRFRIDEKQFDVDGAYNIRYEIIKKRIDKALIRGTNERVTMPGKLAVVYSTAREAHEYRRYLEFLQSRAYLGPGIEELELEDLQGILGLKALRVDVAAPPEDAPPLPLELADLKRAAKA